MSEDQWDPWVTEVCLDPGVEQVRMVTMERRGHQECAPGQWLERAQLRRD